MKKAILIIGMVASMACSAKAPLTHRYDCGAFRFEIIENSMSKINGEYVTSQKIASLGERGAKIDMTLTSAKDGNFYGFEYVHPNGSNKRWLNVELIRSSMSQPRIIGTFMCKRVAG
ncbi:hypothetical protein [Raoultella ornithinolytica]|uniref:hypothetical protein n=2 Tax=Klebsiella/Raoultella group TaxID=2890311 RepID=UPI001F2D07BD|nr:hypothetical protein [Raoultella ornithinolytica]MCF6710238.1 hypothetical protein [Raoultella ornithinolytica]